MGTVGIVTDSTADIPPDLASRLGIAVVPCQVYVGSKAYRDGIELTPGQFYEIMANTHGPLRTSQPPISEFVGAYQQLLGENASEGVISIHVAGELSGTVNAAWAAAQMLPSPSSVEVIDSGQLSMGLGWVAIKAAEWARSGAPRAWISASVRAMLPQIRVAAMIETLEGLRRGGRIGHITAALGTALQIRPLLAVQSGRVSVVHKVRTRARALSQLAEHVRGWGRLANLAVLYTGAEEIAHTLSDLLKDVAPPERTLIAPAGPALTTHLGLGAVGACALLAHQPS